MNDVVYLVEESAYRDTVAVCATRDLAEKFIEENDGNQLRWLSDGSIIPTYTIREISKLTLPVLKNVRIIS
jgi:hypothetical protein